jgi:hypothetical protein
MSAVSRIGERTRLVPYGPLTLGLIQPEWLYMYHYFLEEPEEGEEHPPPGDAGKENREIRINFRARRDPAAP